MHACNYMYVCLILNCMVLKSGNETVFVQVEPFASLAALPRYDVPRVLVNRELVGPFRHHRKRSTDLAVTGDLVDSIWNLVTMAGWRDDLERLVQGGEDDKNGRTLSCILEREETQTPSVVSAAEREICSALSGLTLSESVVNRERSDTSSSSQDNEATQSSSEGGSSSSNSGSSSCVSESSENVTNESTDSSEWSVSNVFSGLKK